MRWVITSAVLVMLCASVWGAEDGCVWVPEKLKQYAGWQVLERDLKSILPGGWEVRTAEPEQPGEPTVRFQFEQLEDEEAFQLQGASEKETRVLLIKGATERALVYGGFRFLQEWRKDADAVWRLNQVSKPRFRLRMIDGSPEEALRGGYNVVLLSGYAVSNLCEYRFAGEDMLGEFRDEIKGVRDAFRKELKGAKELGLKVAILGDEFIFPKELVNAQKWQGILEEDFEQVELERPFGQGKVFCYASERLWEFYREKYREVLKDFPELDLVMVRYGENRRPEPKGAFVGQLVWNFRSPTYCRRCAGLGYEARLQKLMEETYEVVVEEGKRGLVMRSWDLRTDTFHSNPEVFGRITKGMAGKSDFWVSTKYVSGDFWRYLDFNPTFEVKGIKRFVEFQASREYEGKGAFPNFLGEEFQAAMEYLQDKEVEGIWCWRRAGGSAGPEPKLGLWSQANLYALERLSWEKLGAGELARDWASIYLSREGAEGLGELLLKSDDAVKKWRYFAPYGKKHNQWAPAELWIRDDKLRGREFIYNIFREHANEVEELIKEKDEAVRMIEGMQEEVKKWAEKIALQTGIHLDREERVIRGEQLLSFVQSSLAYERALACVLRHYVGAYFYGQRYRETRDKRWKARAEEELGKWKMAWRMYQEEIPQLPLVASLFEDEGMVAAIERTQLYLQYPGIPRFNWWVVGPFDNKRGRGFQLVYGPEAGFAPFAKYLGVNGEVVQWQELPEEHYADDLVKMDVGVEPEDWIVSYAWMEFQVPEAGLASLWLGSDDGIKVWLNGELVHERDVYRAAKPGEEQVEVNLRQGKNTLLIKLTEGLFGAGFYLEFRDEEGKPLESMKPIMIMVEREQ